MLAIHHPGSSLRSVLKLHQAVNSLNWAETVDRRYVHTRPGGCGLTLHLTCENRTSRHRSQLMAVIDSTFAIKFKADFEAGNQQSAAEARKLFDNFGLQFCAFDSV